MEAFDRKLSSVISYIREDEHEKIVQIDNSRSNGQTPQGIMSGADKLRRRDLRSRIVECLVLMIENCRRVAGNDREFWNKSRNAKWSRGLCIRNVAPGLQIGNC